MNYSNASSGNLSFCGFPPFCSLDAIKYCEQTSLRECPHCNVHLASAILAFIIVFGTLTVIGNILVMTVILAQQRKDQTKNDLAKFSLAVADTVKGLGMFTVSVPHLIRTLDLTSTELYIWVVSSRGSVLASVGGSFFFFIFVSSVFHLLYMSTQRFLAIRYPFKYRGMSKRHTAVYLAAIWLLILVTSSIASWAMEDVTFSYNPEIFQFLMVFAPGSITTHNLIGVVVFNVVPYIIIATLNTMTSIKARKARHKSRKLRGSNQSQSELIAADLVACRLSFMMFLNFTATIAPEVIFLFLFATGYLTCATMSVPAFLCFYLALSGGFGNVMVYSIYDRTFRQSLRNYVLKIFKRSEIRGTPSNHGSNVHGSSNGSNIRPVSTQLS